MERGAQESPVGAESNKGSQQYSGARHLGRLAHPARDHRFGEGCRRFASCEAHRYWRRAACGTWWCSNGIRPALPGSGRRITAAVYAIADTTSIDKPGGVFIRRKDQLKPEELLMLRATARVHIPCDGRALGKILATALPDELPGDDFDDVPFIPRAPARSDSRVSRAVRRISAGIPALLTAPLKTTASAFRTSRVRTPVAKRLTLDNGFGGLTPNGDLDR